MALCAISKASQHGLQGCSPEHLPLQTASPAPSARLAALAISPAAPAAATRFRLHPRRSRRGILQAPFRPVGIVTFRLRILQALGAAHSNQTRAYSVNLRCVVTWPLSAAHKRSHADRGTASIISLKMFSLCDNCKMHANQCEITSLSSPQCSGNKNIMDAGRPCTHMLPRQICKSVAAGGLKGPKQRIVVLREPHLAAS